MELIRTAAFRDLDTTTLYALLRLRVDVFVVEQQCAYPELDGRDLEPATLHCWIERDGAPVAYLRVLRDDDAVRIGRVATARTARGHGHARALVSHALTLVSAPVVLDAQSYLRGFYEQLGFRVTGEEFVEDGIPHVPMRRAG